MFPLLSYFVRKTSEALRDVIEEPGITDRAGRVGVAGGVTADAIADATGAHLLGGFDEFRNEPIRDVVIGRINANESYRAAFKKAFPELKTMKALLSHCSARRSLNLSSQSPS